MRSRIEVFDRDLLFQPGGGLSPQEQAAAFAQFTRQAIADATAQNFEALGHFTPYDSIVDGARGAAIESVKPNGVVVTEFELGSDVVAWCLATVKAAAPRASGRFRDSNIVLADGVRVADPDEALPPADEYVILSTEPYARKIEGANGRKAQSSQAPEGIYQVTATMAARRYGNVARIAYGFRELAAGAGLDAPAKLRGRRNRSRAEQRQVSAYRRQPAIIIRLK